MSKEVLRWRSFFVGLFLFTSIPAAFAATPLEIQSSRLNERTGDGDHIPESGETYELILDLKNTSPNPIFSASALVSTANPLVNVTVSVSNFGSIASGATKTNTANPFVFQIRDFQDDPTVDFTVSTNADGITQTLPLTVFLGILKISFGIASSPPAISGNRVVWAAKDTPTSNSDIFLCDLQTKECRRLTTNSFDQVSPSLSITGDRVVWLDCRHSPDNPLCHDVYLYYVSLNLEQRITTTPALNRSAPRIDGSTITWSEDGKIMAYSIASNLTRQISSTGVVTPPAISGTKIVWSIRTDSYNVFLHDLTLNQTRQLSARPNQEIAPDISGDQVVWQEDYCSPGVLECNTGDIYLYNATTNQERLITSEPNWQRNPKISDTQIVYEDNRNGNSDLYLYDLRIDREERLTTHPADQTLPAISEEGIVWLDTRDGTPSIYVKAVKPNSPPVLNPIGNKTVDEGESLAFTLTATDPENNPLTYSATDLPTGASFNTITRIFAWTPSFTQFGTYQITFTVSDGSLSDSETITITVNDVNGPPEPVFITPSSGSSAVDQWVTFTTTYTDPDGVGDLRYCSIVFLPVGEPDTTSDFVRAVYDVSSQKLMLQSGSNWSAAKSPGSSNTLKLSKIQMDCRQTAVTISGETMTITWRLKLRSGTRGDQNTILNAYDLDWHYSGMKQVGTWTVN